MLNAAAGNDLGGRDAAVVCSGIYANHWLSEAVTLLSRQAEHGTRIPIWLFQSGPCGENAETMQIPAPKRVAPNS